MDACAWSPSSLAGAPVSCRKTSSSVGPREGKVAHADVGVAQRCSGVLDQLEPVSRRRQRQPVGPLLRLRLAAAHAAQHGLGLVAARGARKLDLEDLAADPLLQLVPGALGDHPAVVDHGDPIRELVRLLEVLGGQQERRSLADELAHDRPDLVAAARVEPGRRLVEEEDPRPRQQARREVEPAAHPAGVGARRAVGGVGEVEALEQLVRTLPRLRRREVEEAAEHHQVLAAREDLVDRRELPRQAEQLADGGRVVDDVVTEDARPGRRRGSSSVARTRTSVVLPAPFGPSRPNTVPSGTIRSTPASAAVGPKLFVTPSTRTAGRESVADDITGDDTRLISGPRCAQIETLSYSSTTSITS